MRVRPTTPYLIFALIVTLHGVSVADWHHSLYLGNDGCWPSRIRVDVHNHMVQDAAGAPVSVAIGSEAGEAEPGELPEG